MPNNHRDIIAALAAWYSANSSWINGGIIAFIVAMGRAMFYGGKFKASLIDGLLTGLVAVTSTPILSPVLIRTIELIPGMSGVLTETSELKIELFVFAFIGVVGARALREFALARLRKLSGSTQEGQNNE
ncbi:phage holin family protein [Budviciaceae bacterium BWR-B9]|uniref:Phage holin family protein n=1 Tax=Limnobaculum allomyrinae TaxID=2791986 RepID=A0ABS1IWD0_9GAMM|nr:MULTISPECIES: phage holin family protein [Limnobaculum]MBK5145982.1 phage holin family protein [Limnobaculum allomyrinae]MBV7694037.1 phage holin family protein [Limnobaculum sp. M2-1]